MLFTNQHYLEYKNWLQLSKYSDNVRKNYSYYARKLLNKELTQEEINKLCQDSHTVYRSFLKTILKCFNINVEVPTIRGRKEEKEIIYFTKKEVDTILDNVKDSRFNLILRLMFENGLRVTEVMDLQKNSFDMINKRVKGMGKGNKEFNIQIQGLTYDIIKGYLEPFDNEDYIFRFEGIKHQRQKVLYEIKKIIKGILPYKKLKEIFCHAFRHSTGTYLRERGFDLREIQTYLRHKQLETVAAYTSVDKRLLEKKIGEVFVG